MEYFAEFSHTVIHGLNVLKDNEKKVLDKLLEKNGNKLQIKDDDKDKKDKDIKIIDAYDIDYNKNEAKEPVEQKNQVALINPNKFGNFGYMNKIKEREKERQKEMLIKKKEREREIALKKEKERLALKEKRRLQELEREKILAKKRAEDLAERERRKLELQARIKAEKEAVNIADIEITYEDKNLLKHEIKRLNEKEKKKIANIVNQPSKDGNSKENVEKNYITDEKCGYIIVKKNNQDNFDNNAEEPFHEVLANQPLLLKKKSSQLLKPNICNKLADHKKLQQHSPKKKVNQNLVNQFNDQAKKEANKPQKEQSPKKNSINVNRGIYCVNKDIEMLDNRLDELMDKNERDRNQMKNDIKKKR